MGRSTKPTRRRAKRSVPKNAVEAAVWPDGKELYLEPKRGPFQPASTLTVGRARPVAILSTRFVMPANAHAIIIATQIMIQRRLPRA